MSKGLLISIGSAKPDSSGAEESFAKEAFGAMQDGDEEGFTKAFLGAIRACMKGYKDKEPDATDEG